MAQQSKPSIPVERIVALKRFEQPPPAYFCLLPGRIINRIENGEDQSSFWEKFIRSFGYRPLLASALGMTVCVVLTVGIGVTPQADERTAAGDLSVANQWVMRSSATGGTESARVEERWLGSTNPVMAPQPARLLISTPQDRAMPIPLYHGN